MQNRRLKNLACAVVYQAVMDWKWARRTIDRLVDPDTTSKKERLAKAHRLLIDTETFFLGDDFCIFSDLDGKKLLEDLKNSDTKNTRNLENWNFVQ